MLQEAENGVDHMEEVVQEYQIQLQRRLEVANASATVIAFDIMEMDDQADNIEREIQELQQAIEDYMSRGIFRALFGLAKATFCIAVESSKGSVGGVAGCIASALGGIDQADREMIEAVLQGLGELANVIHNAVDVAESWDFTGMTLDTLSTAALRGSVEAKKRGPDFLTLNDFAAFYIGAIQAELGNKIDYNFADLSMIIAKIAAVGQCLVEETAHFSDTLLHAIEKQDELTVAQNDLERAIQYVEDINLMMDQLQETQEHYEEDMDAAREEYEAKVEELSKAFENATQEILDQFHEDISILITSFESTFLELENMYNQQVSNAMTTVLRKRYGLREQSMTQRSMVFTLFADYCDATFYHAFSPCHGSDIPLMSDDFLTIIEKLGKIQWGAITSSESLPGVPIQFGNPNPIRLYIHDNETFLYDQPVGLLRNNSLVRINIQSYDKYEHFKDFWRVRVSMLRMILLDENDKPLASPGEGFGEQIEVLIKYPTIFNDTSFDRKVCQFMSPKFICSSDYYYSEGKHIEQFKAAF
jgi:hypothetical protein